MATEKQYGPPGTTPGGIWYLYEKVKPGCCEYLCSFVCCCQCIVLLLGCCAPGGDDSKFAYKEPMKDGVFISEEGSQVPARNCKNEVSPIQLKALQNKYNPSYKGAKTTMDRD